LSPRVGIVGVGQTKYEDIEKKRGQTYYDMVFEATKKALDDAGLERGDIDTTVEAISTPSSGTLLLPGKDRFILFQTSASFEGLETVFP